MNNRGQTLALGIMASIFILIVGLMMVNFLTPEINNFRTNLNCADASSISDGVKVMCLVTDSIVPYFIVVILSMVIGGITSYFSITNG